MIKVKECRTCAQGFTEDNVPVGNAVPSPLCIPGENGMHHGPIVRIATTLPTYVIDLDGTIVYRENPRLRKLESFQLKVSRKFHSLSSNYSYGSFEGRPLILKSRVGSYRVWFRRGVTKMLIRLGQLGRIVIASHACPWFVDAVASFLRRNVLIAFPIETLTFPRGQLKFLPGDVRLILDDNPQRWVESSRAGITRIGTFNNTTCPTDGALYLLMLQRPDLFPSYNPQNLRALVREVSNARLITALPAFSVDRDGMLLRLVEERMAPVLPLTTCRRFFCGAYKNSFPHAVCELCDTRDSEGSL